MEPINNPLQIKSLHEIIARMRERMSEQAKRSKDTTSVFAKLTELYKKKYTSKENTDLNE